MTSIPKSFVLGAATAAYQIEGAAREDGRGASIWDIFSHTPGRVRNGDTGDIACDHYHRFAEDIDLMKQLGLDAYRFSIAWPRLFPSGSGKLNQAGLDFYKRLVDALLEAGIQPTMTLYHWDLPQPLQEKGGWTNRDTADRFADYADVVFSHFGHSVPRFITLNEPWCSAVLGHLLGTHAPGLSDLGAAIAASHNLLRGHGLAVQAFRAQNIASSQIGITNNLTWVEPASDSPDDLAATERTDAMLNRWFLDPVFFGRYPEQFSAFGIGQLIQPGDMDVIGQPIDFLGVNYYNTNIVRANPADPLLRATMAQPGEQRTAMDWGIAPEGLYQLLMKLHTEYPHLPIYITENGAAFEDYAVDGEIHDPQRIDYVRAHLESVMRANAEGVDVQGYFLWSLLDNFEWDHGYDKRFGIVYVDYDTQARIWKDSAKWYRQLIQTRNL